jgi:hypothetical protein
MTCVATPVPVIKYFCITVSISLVVALVLLFTWYTAWLCRLTTAHENAMQAKVLVEAAEAHAVAVFGTGGIKVSDKDGSKKDVDLAGLIKLIKQLKVGRKTVVSSDYNVVGGQLGALLAAQITGGDEATADPTVWTPPPRQLAWSSRLFAETIAPCLTKLPVKIAVCVMAVALTAITGPIGISNVIPGWGIEDFVNGCGVLVCNPSYVLEWAEDLEDHYTDGPDPVIVAFKNFDINADRAEYLRVLSLMYAGNTGTSPPQPIGGDDGTGKVCPTSCIDATFASFSVYDMFCASRNSSRPEAAPCGATAGYTNADVQAFLDSITGFNKVFTKDVSVGALSSSKLSHFRVHLPFRAHQETQSNMDALEAMNDIVDSSRLEVTAYGQLFPLYSMFVRISSLVCRAVSTGLL